MKGMLDKNGVYWWASKVKDGVVCYCFPKGYYANERLK